MATSNQFYDPLRQAELAQYGGMTAAQYANSLFKQDTAPVSLPNGGLVLQAGRGSTISPEDVQKYTASGMNLNQINSQFGDPAITQRIVNPAVANPVVPYTPPSNAMANPWQTQPKAPPRQTAGAAQNPPGDDWQNRLVWADWRGSRHGGNTGAPGSGGLPPGFDIRLGSNDPAINRQVYGDNYFPGGLPGFENILTKEQFFALTPAQQGSYREALYLYNQRRNGAGPQPGGVVPPLPGDPVGNPGYRPGTPPGPETGFRPGPPPGVGGGGSGGLGPALPPPPSSNAMAGYPGGRGNYMGYGPNGGGLRVDPNYLPEYWDNYQDSPEFKWRLAQAEKAMNRRLLSFGRSDSSGGHNIMGNLYSDITADERDKQYQRNLMANTENYQRYLGANNINYGRTQSEDQTGWNRAWDIDNRDWTRSNYLGEQDWNRNFALANMGFDATRSGVGAGSAASVALAQLLNENGANQASLALSSGRVSADMISSLLSSGFGFDQIEKLFGGGTPLGGVPGPGAPPPPPPSGAGVGDPTRRDYFDGSSYGW